MPQEDTHDQKLDTSTGDGNTGTTHPAAENAEDQHDQQTQAAAEDSGATPPEADEDRDDSPAQKTLTQAEVDALLKKRLGRERKKWEEERQEAERRARMDEAERLKAELADRDKAIAEREAELKRERVMRSLSGKVVDPEDAYAIAERLELVDEETGTVDIDALLTQKPYLAPQQPGPPPKQPTSGAGGAAVKPPSLADVARMSPSEYEKHREQVYAALRQAE